MPFVEISGVAKDMDLQDFAITEI